MIFLKDNLRSHVLTGATQAFSELIFVEVLGPAKVTYLNIEVVVKQNILWLKIPVHDSL